MTPTNTIISKRIVKIDDAEKRRLKRLGISLQNGDGYLEYQHTIRRSSFNPDTIKINYRKTNPKIQKIQEYYDSVGASNKQTINELLSIVYDCTMEELSEKYSDWQNIYKTTTRQTPNVLRILDFPEHPEYKSTKARRREELKDERLRRAS